MLSQRAPDQHRAKRPFQPAITSFFACDDFDHLAADHSLAHSPAPHSLAPALPGPVQADLLSVGMRVRKSVPEGYKTPKPALPTIHTPRLAVQPPPPPPPPSVPDDAQHQRELLPFCGLHKIGGFAEQPTTNPHLYARADSPHARPANLFPLPPQAFTTPFSSHCSTDSGYGSDSRPHNPSKRSWSDDDDKNAFASSFMFSIPMKIAADDDVPVSPLSATPPPAFAQLPPPRAFAQPKSRRQQRAAQPDMDVDMDFDDADFLDGSEVAMSGM
jgi:hypothetical protein